MTSLTIGKKLSLSFGGLATLLALMGGLWILSVSQMGTALEKTVQFTARKVAMASDISISVMGMIAAQRSVLLAHLTNDSAELTNFERQFETSSQTVARTVDELEPMLETARGKRAVADMRQNFSTWVESYGEMKRLCDAGRLDDANRVRIERSRAPSKAMLAASNSLALAGREIMAAADENGNHISSQSRWAALTLLGLSLSVGAIVVLLIRQIVGHLQRTVVGLEENAKQVASAAGQISQSSQSLAQGASEQAATLEQTSASSEEINAMAQRNTEDSRSAAELVSGSQQKIGETNRALEDMVVAIGEINTSSSKISKIIKVIDEIAFQTNILALNASVEAARAGEAGMGFAVVADEVRNLARRCASAASDTTSLIEESITKSHEGQTKVDYMATSIRSVTEDSAKVKSLVDDVKQGSQEQARGIEEIARAISQMETVTQSSAASAEQSAAAATELSSQAASLMEIVQSLTAIVGSAAGGRRA